MIPCRFWCGYKAIDEFVFTFQVLWKGLAKIKKLNIDLQVKRKTSDETDAKFHDDINVSFCLFSFYQRGTFVDLWGSL